MVETPVLVVILPVAVVDADRGGGAADRAAARRLACGPLHVAIGERGVEARSPLVGIGGEGDLEGVALSVLLVVPADGVPRDNEDVIARDGVVDVHRAVPDQV